MGGLGGDRGGCSDGRDGAGERGFLDRRLVAAIVTWRSGMMMRARMKVIATVLLLILCGPVRLCAAQEDAPAGFSPLFNGWDLSGWSVDGGDATTWSVEDGAIVARGRDY